MGTKTTTSGGNEAAAETKTDMRQFMVKSASGKEYLPTIGIEVHAELKTATKMFCNSANDPHHAEPNTHICPVCMAHPGTLPTVNKEAVRKVLLVGMALGSDIATYTEFDRKNYFYPDIPKAYQISQYKFALVKKGLLAGVDINRVHLEEDTASSKHEGAFSLVDFNRAGVPLMELVTEPVIHDAKTAGNFTRELQLLLKTLGVSGADMSRGEMRVEANISVSEDPEKLATGYVEVKNLNSFKVMEKAIDFEIKRQMAAIEAGEEIVKETRGWDENKERTFTQRVKESADDYRYFPDPDIPKLDLAEIEEFAPAILKKDLPELPAEKRVRYAEYGLNSDQIETIITAPALEALFEAVLEKIVDKKVVKTASNYLTSDVVGILAEETGSTIAEAAAEKLDVAVAPQFVELIEMVAASEINSRVAKDLLQEVVFEGKSPKALAEERGLVQDNSEEALVAIIEPILKEHVAVVEEYKGGKEASLQFLVGQGMKATKGAANPQLLAELIKKLV